MKTIIFKLLIFLLPITLLANEVVWNKDSRGLSNTEQKEIIKQYVDKTYPKDVEKYKKDNELSKLIVVLKSHADWHEYLISIPDIGYKKTFKVYGGRYQGYKIVEIPLSGTHTIEISAKFQTYKYWNCSNCDDRKIIIKGGHVSKEVYLNNNKAKVLKVQAYVYAPGKRSLSEHEAMRWSFDGKYESGESWFW